MTGIFRGTGTSGTGVPQADTSTKQDLLVNSAGLAAALNDETGTGLAVFNTSPTLITPSLGVATGTSFNSITALSSTTPAMDGVAAVGTGTTTARGDHVHPSDTSRALLAGSASQTFSASTLVVSTAAGTSIPVENVTGFTYLNSWVSALTGTGYWKDTSGLVHLRGQISTGTNGTIFATLPVGYRPACNEAYATTYFTGAAFATSYVFIATNGDCTIYFAGGMSYVSLAGITFRST